MGTPVRLELWFPVNGTGVVDFKWTLVAIMKGMYPESSLSDADAPITTALVARLKQWLLLGASSSDIVDDITRRLSGRASDEAWSLNRER
ncbi:hypothetical protein HGRIS_014354 [Hohenbuehelia grisea]|uniref:Uncharacterized protein n=1 Tax=Hohenbuehelia grisea TaxID=104357 RepID=A0ABR3JT91_9AGAR